MTRWVLGFLVGALAGVPALAQSNVASGELHGVVTDPSGGLVPSAQVTVHNEVNGPSAYLEAVQEYWRTAQRAYLESVGTTFQAGLIHLGTSEDPVTQSNLHLAAAAGIRPGHRVLDAGCGVCGPSMDIARHIEGVQIAAVTISPEQAATAKKLIRQAKLSSKIEVRIADYHQLPFPDDFFDVVCFFESVGYSYDLPRLFSEVFRVIRPGGVVYIKDVFCQERPLSRAEREDLAEFNRIFAQFQTPTLSHVRKALAEAGFERVRGRDLTKRITTAHSLNAMFESRNGSVRPTEFGKLHFRAYRCTAVCFGEIKAVRPIRKRRDRANNGKDPPRTKTKEESMAKRTKFEKLLDKVVAEPAFGKRLYRNPRAALREVGIRPTDAIVGALRDASGAPEKVRRAMDKLGPSKTA